MIGKPTCGGNGEFQATQRSLVINSDMVFDGEIERGRRSSTKKTEVNGINSRRCSERGLRRRLKKEEDILELVWGWVKRAFSFVLLFRLKKLRHTLLTAPTHRTSPRPKMSLVKRARLFFWDYEGLELNFRTDLEI